MMSSRALQEQETRKSLSAVSDVIHSAPKKEADFLSGLEQQMKDLWSQYVRCLDQGGLTEAAKKLRNQYYNLYRCYRQNRVWKNAINNN